MGKVIKWGLLGLGMTILLLLVWGSLIEPYLTDVERETAMIPNLPSSWQGRQVGVIGDFQVGMWGDNEATVRKAVRQLVELHPHVVLLLGDFVYHAPQNSENSVQTVVQALIPLMQAKIPTYAVLGNHDYQVNELGEKPNTDLAHRLESELEAIGVTVLHNEVVALPGQNPGEPSLSLVGIDAFQPQLDKPVGVFNGIPEDKPRLVMMHNPASFASVPESAAPFAVAGHTHGGQIRVPFTPEWSYLTYLQSEPVHADGWINGYGKRGNRLYVNRGIGFSILPLRINCMPEVTLFTLQGV